MRIGIADGLCGQDRRECLRRGDEPEIAVEGVRALLRDPPLAIDRLPVEPGRQVFVPLGN